MLLPQKWADPKNPWIPLSKCTHPFSRIMCIIISFEENWYDSVDSIKDLDEEALAKMKVPLRLIEVIVKKLGKGKPEPQPQQPTKMVIEVQSNSPPNISNIN